MDAREDVLKPVLRRPWLAVIAAGVSTAMVAGPAAADSVTIPDADDDAIVVVGDLVEFGDFDIDLRSILVDHGTDNLVVTSSFSFTNADSWTDIILEVDTNFDGRSDFRALWSKDSVAGVVSVNGDGSLGAVTCGAIGTGERQGASGTTTLTIPRSCLGNPQSLAVHLDVFWFGYNTEDEDLTFVDSAPGMFIDDPVTFSGPIAAGSTAVVPSPSAPSLVDSAVSVKLSKKTQKFGAAPAKIKVRVAAGAAGSIKVLDGRKLLRTFGVAAGQTVAYKLPRRLKPGLHRIKVRFTPADAARFTSSSTVVKVRVSR